jgi:nitrite reductase/ring-hydroxylating ferredoxin subunit
MLSRSKAPVAVCEATGSAKGPDLRQGIAVAKLHDGAMLRGHVGETPVMLVRHGAEALAIGATCAHYGGPLLSARLRST